MSADEHLGAQWPSMSLDEIKRLPSVDAIDMPGGGTVADILPYKRREAREDYAEHTPTRVSMKHEGQTYPIHIGPAHQVLSAYGANHKRHEYAPDQLMVGNGGHRIAMAEDLGWKQMHYSSNQHDTGDEYDDDALDKALSRGGWK